jgi:hypothetical protein
MTDLSRFRKRQLREADATAGERAANEIDIIAAATIAYSSEDPAHPIEHAFDGYSGPGATRWISARDNTVEHILIEFDRPQIISPLSYEVEERTLERTQEVRGEISDDGGRTYRQIFVQDYTFSPQGATYQRKQQRLDRVPVDSSPPDDCSRQEWRGSGDIDNAPPLHLTAEARRIRFGRENAPGPAFSREVLKSIGMLTKNLPL